MVFVDVHGHGFVLRAEHHELVVGAPAQTAVQAVLCEVEVGAGALDVTAWADLGFDPTARW